MRWALSSFWYAAFLAEAKRVYGVLSSLPRARHIAPILLPISPNVALGNLVTTSTLLAAIKRANAEAGFLGGAFGVGGTTFGGFSEEFSVVAVGVVVAAGERVVVVAVGVVVAAGERVVVVVVVAADDVVVVVAASISMSTCSMTSTSTGRLDDEPTVLAFFEASLTVFAFFFLFLSSRLEMGLSPRLRR